MVPAATKTLVNTDFQQQQFQADESKKLTMLFWKNVAFTVLFATAAVIVTAMAVSLAPVGGAVPLSIIAALCATASYGGIIESRRLWKMREECGLTKLF